MTDRDGSFYLEPDVYLFTKFTLVRGEMVAFIAQLEIYRDGRWYSIVRYDTVHGEAHIDYLDPGGKEYDKVWLGVRAPYNKLYAAITAALRAEYQKHIVRWERQRGRR